MKSKRLIALAAALLLLCGMCSAFAAGAGSASDPLLSRSYLTSWSNGQLQSAAAMADSAVGTARRSALLSANQIFTAAANNGIRAEVLPLGALIALTTGDFFTLTAGSATIRIQSGVLVDATLGQTVSSGNLTANHRYIACEGLSAVLTCTAQNTALLLSGAATVSHFSDVAPTAWYAKAVDYTYTTNLIAGMSATEFGPSLTLTRAMFITILGRLAGVDVSAYSGTSFSDVPTGQWYSPYIEWGAKTGIVAGMGNGTFLPNSPVTREQMASFIERYLTYKGLSLPQICEVPAVFADQEKISVWAKDSVELVRQTGIICGDTAGYFNPGSSATRAEAASMFTRLDGAIALT